ncbi:helix-turn-helix domain-containing protein [Buttiauxella sp. WJP83]|uniref:helix-turn-helix domain-containing protein n=1 Tax=Buttiauxella sp. WJP83 TaxID=2986951 RepID=UPI0022DD9FCB|nr:helix-turn-helix domain-containing protein [Buttiauxella sp. WJP83]WBM72466.1 helix-turn-helix domain-containing protein [Buttiauxella sp. WJP83]
MMKPSEPEQDEKLVIQSQATLDLVDMLSPLVTFEKVPALQRLYYSVDGVHMCYIIRSGSVMVRRDTDEIVITYLLVPNITGVSNLLPSSVGLFLETLSECEIAILTTDDARKLINDTNAWEALAGHIAKVSANLFKHNVIMTAPTAYQVVRFQLISLMQEEENIRETTSIIQYVLQRTRLSRSSVMKILAQLKQGGYIETKDGFLTKLNSLPARY